MPYQRVYPNLYLIDLVQKREGLREFISSWLFRTDDFTFLVDPGPLYSIDQLLQALSEIGVTRIDYILLTHIHIDHAGGVGKLLKSFPEAKVNCHPKGMEHMIDPTRLWKGSQKVLGAVAQEYGEILPIPKENLIYIEEISTSHGEINALDTPGHAPHHLCYLFNGLLFAGEVAGVYHSHLNHNYQRPATPPVFKLEISLKSLDKIIALKPEVICFSHFGIQKEAENALQTARMQLILWTDVVKDQLQFGEDNIHERTINVLLKKDAVFSAFEKMPEDIQKREAYFLENAIDGIREYLSHQI